MIYLDNAATTQIYPEVFEEMRPYLCEEYGNPGGLYSVGRSAKDAVRKARERVADFICSSPEQIVFTSGGSEANSLAVLGSAPYLKMNGKTNIVSDVTEHASVYNAIRHACYAYGLLKKSFVFPDKLGSIHAESIKGDILPGTGLVSVMYVNNETGAVNDVQKISELCAENGVLFHTDCVQAAASAQLDVNKIGCDMMSISSHKIHGPKGVGALFVKNPDILAPIIAGGEEQEFGLRGGTANVAGIVGFGKACELMKQNSELLSRSEFAGLKTKFYTSLSDFISLRGIPVGVSFNGPSYKTPGNILSILFDGVDAETLVLTLDRLGVCVSAGSACNGHSHNPSRVLKAIGLSDEQARSTVRVSFSNKNTASEAVEAAHKFAEALSMISETFPRISVSDN